MRAIRNTFLKIVIFLIFLGAGYGASKLYQPHEKTVRIYKQALKDYENQNFSNSYYLFSKIGYLSNLKPVAIYRQSLCAKALGDKNSELNRLELLNRYYPKHQLIPKSKYRLAQLLIEERPDLAVKYFKSVIEADLAQDYKIASEYFLARIEARKVKFDKTKLPQQKLEKIENSFRQYLEKVPDGRLASEVAQNWLRLDSDIAPKDALLIAKAFYNDKKYDETLKILEKLENKNSWALKALTNMQKQDYNSIGTLIAEGVEKYSEDVNYEDLKLALDTYFNLLDAVQKKKYFDKIYSAAQKGAKEYLTHYKCTNLSDKARYECFSTLYKDTNFKRYNEESLLEMFNYNISKKDYINARQMANDFMQNYPKSKSFPRVKFWDAKIMQYYSKPEYTLQLGQIIEQYPDSYYAYRAFWIIKNIKFATANLKLDNKAVEYPYRYPTKGTTAYNLIQIGDYLMLYEILSDDFIQSWGEYKKGNYATSMYIAGKAMDKIYPKPPKTDLRWRLVYPQNYFKQVQVNANNYKNDEALIMAIIRAESSFNSEAQSLVGAIGLMQLMPTTAHEIGLKSGMEFNTNYLLNPELNIKLGNIYYSQIKKSFDNEIFAIASYNAGPAAVSKWRSSFKYKDIDEFVEQIPYDETREYVKKVFANYWNYIKIYQKS